MGKYVVLAVEGADVLAHVERGSVEPRGDAGFVRVDPTYQDRASRPFLPKDTRRYDDLAALIRDDFGGGWMHPRVVAEARPAVERILGTLGNNPPPDSPDPAREAGRILGVEVAEPLLHFALLSSGGVGHGGVDTRSAEPCTWEWVRKVVDALEARRSE